MSEHLLIIDDHPLYREALAERLIKDFEDKGIHINTTGSVKEGLEILAQSNDNWCVVLDILMPGVNGLTCIKTFKSLSNVKHLVAITGLEEHVWSSRCISAGASLFLSKNNSSDLISRKLLDLIQSDASEIIKEAISLDEFRLTSRQLEVLHLIAKGHPNKIIADLLNITEQTVKIHINQIFKELGVFNRTQAVLKAQTYLLI